MKRALVLSLIFVFGLGFAAFGELTGTWETTLEISPMASAFDDFVTSIGSDLEVAFITGDWTFSSESSFGLTGYNDQVFEVAGILGAFTLSAELDFDPQRVTVWTCPTIAELGITTPLTQTPSATICETLCDAECDATTWVPAFESFEAELGVSIAGVDFGVFFLLDQSNYNVQYVNKIFKLDGTPGTYWDVTSYNNGAGWKFSISGSIGGMTVTSYTYFNLSEYNARSTFCPEIGKRGVFVIPTAGCDVGFYEEFVMIEGLTFGCASIDAELSITCSGFDHVKFVVSDISIGGWATFDFGIIFTTTSKTIDLCLGLDAYDFDCLTVEIGFGDLGYVYGSGPLDITNITIHGVGFSYSWNGVTFTSYTEFDVYSQLFSPYLGYRGIHDWSYLNGDEEDCFLVPFGGVATITLADPADCCDEDPTSADCTYWNVADEYYQLVCVPLQRYKLWEMFEIELDADSCCGGVFGATVTTYFGDLQELSYFGYAVIPDGSTTAGATTWLLGSGTAYSTAAGYYVSSAVCYDTVMSKYGYADVSGASQLFNWAVTEVDMELGIGSNITLDLGASISQFGWESLSFGFTFEW